MLHEILYLIAILTGVGIFFVSLARGSAQKIKLHRLSEEFSAHPRLYFLISFLQHHGHREGKSSLLDALDITCRITRLLFVASLSLYLLTATDLSILSPLENGDEHALLPILATIGLIVLFVLLIDLITALFATLSPRAILRFSAPMASLFLALFLPITLLFIKVRRSMRKEENDGKNLGADASSAWLKEHLLDILQENELLALLTPADQKILKLLSSFWEKRVSQIMVPRIKMVMLPASSSIEEAAALFQKEGFSRIPLYENREEVIGVLHYKSLFSYCVSHAEKQSEWGHTPVRELVSEAFFTPEIMRISVLLQEFRKRNAHLAVVVDEYGAAVGVVTIEDILEEIVGEIEDELDTELEFRCSRLQDGSWLVHGSCTLQDLDKEGIHIEHEEEETLSGLVIASIGHIPKEHQKIEFEDYTLEIVKATERAIELVRIIERHARHGSL